MKKRKYIQMRIPKGLSLLTLLLLVSVRLVSQVPSWTPALSDSGSWSIILLPDVQGYAKFTRNQPIFDLMVRWIEDNRERLDIQMVLCTGDIVEQNYITALPEENGDQLSSVQWRFMSETFGRLDRKLPYVLCTGNHDYGTNHTENRYSQFNSFFPPDKNPLTQALLVDMAPNASGVKTLENACYAYNSPLGQQLLIFSLEYAPRKAVVDWAKEMMDQPAYANHTGVLLTHSYMRSSVKGNERIEQEDYPPGFSDMTTGQQLWDRLVSVSPNLRLVLCGHVVDVASHEGHVGFRTDTNQAGKTVNQMLFNAQNEGGNWKGNGGDGWLRILEFLPDGKTVQVRTFSPLFASSPATAHLAWRTDKFDQFSFELNRNNP